MIAYVIATTFVEDCFQESGKLILIYARQLQQIICHEASGQLDKSFFSSVCFAQREYIQVDAANVHGL